MADWNKNNLAHTNTFLALRILAHTNKKFAAAGAQKLGSLALWVAGESPAMRKGKANSLATQLHNLFDMVFRATLENGVTKASSIKAMAELLLDSNNTINALADAADEKFDFSIGETA